MNPNPPPPNSEEPEERSQFEDFINRSLNLDGLEEEESVEEDAAFAPDDPNHILIRFQLPGGGPMLTGTFGPVPADGGPRLPPLPMLDDVRWQFAVMRSRPAQLRLQQPRFNYEAHSGQLALPLDRRSSRRLHFIRDVRPGWTAVRYHVSGGAVGELIQWKGNRATAHRLRLGGKDLSGFVKTNELPELLPIREFRLLQGLGDVIETILIIAAIAIAAAVLVQALTLGGQPAITDLQARIDMLQGQVATLEAQVDAAPANPLP